MVLEFPLTRDFYSRYKDNPKEGQLQTFAIAKKLALAFMEKRHLRGDDLDTLAVVLNSFGKEANIGIVAKVEGNKVIARNTSLCPIMLSARAYKIPWDWMDEVVGWPFMAGLASAVNPKVKQSITRARVRGDPECEHVFEIG